jgi:Protein of unknown function (DUF1573)
MMGLVNGKLDFRKSMGMSLAVLQVARSLPIPAGPAFSMERFTMESSAASPQSEVNERKTFFERQRPNSCRPERTRAWPMLFVVLLDIAGHVNAQAKSDGMFDELSYDFGSVPRGQIVSHPFRIVNNTKELMHISNVRVSCGVCSSARALQTSLQPGEETAIIATMDTNRFVNTKIITIYVTFDQPRPEEVRLRIHADSRDDVSFTPENIAFGKIKRGEEPMKKLTVTFLGSAETKISKMSSDSNYVQPTIKETKRTASETSYEITAKLRKDTPAGNWHTDIWLTTNHPAMPKLRVPVTVDVQDAISLSPKSVTLGQVKD